MLVLSIESIPVLLTHLKIVLGYFKKLREDGCSEDAFEILMDDIDSESRVRILKQFTTIYNSELFTVNNLKKTKFSKLDRTPV